jgi:hypothetical protein
MPATRTLAPYMHPVAQRHTATITVPEPLFSHKPRSLRSVDPYAMPIVKPDFAEVVARVYHACLIHDRWCGIRVIGLMEALRDEAKLRQEGRIPRFFPTEFIPEDPGSFRDDHATGMLLRTIRRMENTGWLRTRGEGTDMVISLTEPTYVRMGVLQRRR